MSWIICFASPSQVDDDSWTMSFVMPSKYGMDGLPVPIDDSVRIHRVPERLVAVAAFPGFVSRDDVKQQEQVLRERVAKDGEYVVKANAQVEVAQVMFTFKHVFPC